MDNPLHEISRAIDLCAGAANADIQISAFHTYFTSDASFLHPLCYVPAGLDSRKKVIGIFLFYRIAVPSTSFDIVDVAFDEKPNGKTGHLFVNLVQSPALRGITALTGWRPSIDMHIHFDLRKEGDGKWRIARQEDVVQPMTLMLAIPGLRSYGKWLYWICEMLGLFNAWLFIVLGVWRPEEHIRYGRSHDRIAS